MSDANNHTITKVFRSYMMDEMDAPTHVAVPCVGLILTHSSSLLFEHHKYCIGSNLFKTTARIGNLSNVLITK